MIALDKPKKLKKNIITSFVPKNATGAYSLGDKPENKFRLKYVGRSDTILRKRLLDHCKKRKYSHFSVEITDSILKAYKIECREWHNAVDLDNKIHPRKPKNLNYKCPYCRKKDGGYTEWEIGKK